MTDNMTPDEYKAMVLKTKKPRKYRNKPVIIDGHKFPSQGEGARYRHLKGLEKAGLIFNLELQPVFKFYCGKTPVLFETGRHAKYTADFRYLQYGSTVVEDFKGYDTTESRLRRALVKAHYGITVQIVK